MTHINHPLLFLFFFGRESLPVSTNTLNHSLSQQQAFSAVVLILTVTKDLQTGRRIRIRGAEVPARCGLGTISSVLRNGGCGGNEAIPWRSYLLNIRKNSDLGPAIGLQALSKKLFIHFVIVPPRNVLSRSLTWVHRNHLVVAANLVRSPATSGVWLIAQ